MKLIKIFLQFCLIGFLTFGCDMLESNNSKGPDMDYKIGQMVLVGFRGTTLEESSHIVSDIKENSIGGVILYDYDVPSGSSPRNIVSPTQTDSLTTALQNLTDDKLLICVDQEGGTVARLKPEYGFPKTVSAQYLGELNNPDTTAYWSNSIASTLNSMDININCTPVVDLNINPNCPAIGALGRSFSANPETVIENAEIFIAQHHNNSILTTLKHFPGHGSSEEDSHLGFVDITETWDEIELEPYQYFIENDLCDLIMTAHVFNANLDENYPATLSHNIISTILRDSLGWDGIIVSDDMQMGAITNNYGFETAIEKSINAGVDLLIFSNNSPSGYNQNIATETISTIKSLIRSGSISKSRINESFQRIQDLKKRLF